jgi:hypothetical protein
MVTVLGLVLSVLLAAPPAPAHRPADVELIANWLCGKDRAEAFGKPFGDRKTLADSKAPLLYTDIAGARPPAGMKVVNYESIQARMRLIRNGHRTDPAVLIVRSSVEEPADEGSVGEIRVEKGKPDGRVYYIAVAIGNLAWHWLKVVVRDEGKKPKAEILWAKVS